MILNVGAVNGVLKYLPPKRLLFFFLTNLNLTQTSNLTLTIILLLMA